MYTFCVYILDIHLLEGLWDWIVETLELGERFTKTEGEMELVKDRSRGFYNIKHWRYKDAGV